MKTTHLPFILIALCYGYITGHYWNEFSIRYSIPEYENRYGHSQYVMGPAYTHLMGDGDIYTYAGIRYIQGEDPSVINFEHPPFIKYLFGLSYLLTGIPNWANTLLLVCASLSFWYVLRLVVLRPLWRYVALCLFLLNPIIYSYYTQTMLDFGTMALSLGVLACFVAINSSPSWSRLALFSIISGLFITAKYPLPINAVLIVLLMGWLLLNKRVTFFQAASTAFGIVVVYLMNYLGFFLHHHSLYDWVKFEWNRWQWYQGKLASTWGSIVPIIYTGKRPVVWDMCPDYAKVKWWHVGVPGTFTMYSLSMINIKTIAHHLLLPYFSWLLLAFIILLFGADSDRFLVPLVPGWILFGVWWLESISNGKVIQSLRASLLKNRPQ